MFSTEVSPHPRDCYCSDSGDKMSTQQILSPHKARPRPEWRTCCTAAARSWGAAERPADKSDLCSVLLLIKTILQNMGHQNKFYGPAPCRCIAKIHCIHLSFFPVDLKSIFRINARWNCKCWDVMWAEIVPVTAGSKSDRYSFIAAACLFEQSVNIKVTRRIDCTK